LAEEHILVILKSRLHSSTGQKICWKFLVTFPQQPAFCRHSAPAHPVFRGAGAKIGRKKNPLLYRGAVTPNLTSRMFSDK
jgi:hypothetical protein